VPIKRPGLAAAGFDGGPEVFDGIEVGRAGRQKQQWADSYSDQRRRGRRLMETGVVQPHAFLHERLPDMIAFSFLHQESAAGDPPDFAIGRIDERFALLVKPP